jgi:hypothetical protein
MAEVKERLRFLQIPPRYPINTRAHLTYVYWHHADGYLTLFMEQLIMHV